MPNSIINNAKTHEVNKSIFAAEVFFKSPLTLTLEKFCVVQNQARYFFASYSLD